MIDIICRTEAWMLTQLSKEMNDLIKASPKDTVMIKNVYYPKIITEAHKFVQGRKLTPMENLTLTIAEEWFTPC